MKKKMLISVISVTMMTSLMLGCSKEENGSVTDPGGAVKEPSESAMAAQKLTMFAHEFQIWDGL